MTQPAEPTRTKDSHRAIGELLLQARTDGGLTAQEVCELTRITPEMLRRVEAGQFDQCGGDIYARGHIRAYAQAVGLDPEPLLTMFGLVHLPPLTKRDLRKPRTITPAAGPGKANASASAGAKSRGRGKDKGRAKSRAKAKGKDKGQDAEKDAAAGSARRDARQAAADRARAVLPTIVPGAVPSLVPMAGAAPAPDVPALRQPRRREDYTDADSGSAARLVEPLVSDGAAVNEAPAAFLGGAKSAGRAAPNWSLALLGALGAVGLVAAVQLWPHNAAASTGSSVAPKAHAAAPAKPAAPAPSPASAAPKAPVDLRISTKNAPVWVGVTNAAGQQLYWNVLDAGQTKEFTDDSRLDLTVGDATGVALQFNGKDVPVQGGDGQVLTTSFGPSGQQ